MQLELLSPARNCDIGIAAIDCGADAVYIAGPKFGARQAAGNEIGEINRLCSYAHKFGARIFVTLNTILYEDELDDAYRQMLLVQEAGADAVIVQDLAVMEMAKKGYAGLKEPFRLPLHASTQCAIRTPEEARFYEDMGFSRLILERELSLDQIRAIRDAVSCELEFFVHGALCVCYSGQCYMSEAIAGRSANRGACIQACRSLYDLADKDGQIIVRNKALLSLKDLNLKDRLADLADAGITSFKIEGRLKNMSYVKNVVRDYSLALDSIADEYTGYVRASYGKSRGGFSPDTYKTFNRGYTSLFIDGKKGGWTSMDAAKSMGEEIGTVVSVSRKKDVISIKPAKDNTILHNGDGFSFVSRDGEVSGFRGDVCNGTEIRCKSIPQLTVGTRLFRNIDTGFEKEIERNSPVRVIDASVSINIERTDIREKAVGTAGTDPVSAYRVIAEAVTCDGRTVRKEMLTEAGPASNTARMSDVFVQQLSKSTGHYRFSVREVTHNGDIPFLPASVLNAMRRDIAAEIDRMPCRTHPLENRTAGQEKTAGKGLITYKSNVSNSLSRESYRRSGAEEIEKAYEITHRPGIELMRSRYCIRYELGICPKQDGKCRAKILRSVPSPGSPLFLLNNGQRFELRFDCANCEMTVLSES